MKQLVFVLTVRVHSQFEKEFTLDCFCNYYVFYLCTFNFLFLSYSLKCCSMA